MAKSIEIMCSECGKDAMVRREPVYEGLNKVGEKFLCSACGYEFEREEMVPFKEKKKLDIFNSDDLLESVDVFSGDEKDRNCRRCKHYTVNPFTQRCGLDHKIVEATDVCEKFECIETTCDRI